MQENKNDHDLLITLHQEMKEARNDIKNLGDNLVGRVQSLEQTYMSQTEVEKCMTTLANTLREESRLKMALQDAEISRTSKIVYGACAFILLAFLASLVK